MSESLSERLRRGDALYGALLDLTDPTMVELMAHAGCDYVVLEHEHGLRSLDTMQSLIRAAEGAGIASIVRTGSPDRGLISRFFEAGASGIMVAHITSRADAELIVAAAKYPPEGTRGQGYVRRGRLWKLGPESTRLDAQSNRDSVVLATIEDREGVDNVEEILSVPGLTGLALGPADLAASLGGLELDSEEVSAALERVRQAVRAHPDRCMLELLARPDEAPALIARGTQLLMLNHDVIIVGEHYESLLAAARVAATE